jgi:hypothetical protein
MVLGENPINLHSSSPIIQSNKLECLPLACFFQANLTFASKAGCLPIYGTNFTREIGQLFLM